MGFIAKLFASLIVVLIAVVGFVYSGIFNVSAQWEDPALLRWLLASTREASVESRAENIKSPILGSATQIKNGFRSYREMCAVCHTPPGGTDSPIKQGLNPSPPNLAVAEDHAMTEAQLFWVIKNGIRMTGMPAWGPSHDDAEIWDIVAFIKALPTIDADEYQRLNTQTTQGHGHSGSEPMATTQGHMDNTDNHSNPVEEVPAIEYIDNGTHAH